MFDPVLSLWLVTAGTAGYGLLRFAELPQRMAAHFDARGIVDGWMAKPAFLAVLVGAMVLLGAVFTALALVLPRMPDGLVNIPNRSYWLGPERRAESMAWISRLVAWIGVATECFLTAVLALVIEVNLANETPARLGPGAAGVLGVFLVVVLGLVVAIVLRFGRVPRAQVVGAGSTSPRR